MGLATMGLFALQVSLKQEISNFRFFRDVGNRNCCISFFVSFLAKIGRTTPQTPRQASKRAPEACIPYSAAAAFSLPAICNFLFSHLFFFVGGEAVGRRKIRLGFPLCCHVKIEGRRRRKKTCLGFRGKVEEEKGKTFGTLPRLQCQSGTKVGVRMRGGK